jgi:hypothetical protein
MVGGKVLSVASVVLFGFVAACSGSGVVSSPVVVPSVGLDSSGSSGPVVVAENNPLLLWRRLLRLLWRRLWKSDSTNN